MFRVVMAGVLGCCVVAGRPRENLERRDDLTLARVGIVHGNLRVGRGPSTWRIRRTPRGVLIYLARGEAAGAWGGWYLNYDHRGNDRVIGLVQRPGPGCYWTWSEGAWEQINSGFGYTFPCTARPANGPMRGWSLTLEKSRLVLHQGKAAVTFEGTIDDLNDGK